MPNSSRDKKKKARTAVVGRGEKRKRRARHVTPDLSYYWEGAREKCEDNKWDGKEKSKYIKCGRRSHTWYDSRAG